MAGGDGPVLVIGSTVAAGGDDRRARVFLVLTMWPGRG
jgi:hypothetical protein